MHIWKWTDNCLPKRGGGAGLRRVADIVEAARRLVWRKCNTTTPWS